MIKSIVINEVEVPCSYCGIKVQRAKRAYSKNNPVRCSVCKGKYAREYINLRQRAIQKLLPATKVNKLIAKYRMPGEPNYLAAFKRILDEL